MNSLDRRHLLKSAVGASAAFAAGQWLQPAVTAADPPKERIKIGQIGTGHEHASGKMATFRKLSDHYEVVGIAEPDAGLRKSHEAQPAYRDLPWMSEEELLRVEGLRAVAVEVSSADPRIMEVTGKCIEAGMHVHLDKPGGESLSAFKKVLDEAGRRNLAVQLGYMYRNNPAVQFCQRAVREGWLGQVFEIHCVMSTTHSLPYRKYLAQFRGGSMFIFACHLIDLVVSLMGKPDGIVSYPRQTRDDVGVEMCDNGLIVFEYPRTTVTVRTASLEVDGHRRRQLVVCGDRGTIDIQPLETITVRPYEPQSLRLTLAEARDPYQQGRQDVSFPLQAGRYDDQLIELAEIIRGERENPYPLEHELIVQQCLLEACGYPLS
ncbi:MAG: Gfo/Idh/MocA family oxidoreductase [Thermoguttaceae bacterium]|jgi:predicted dehydrogenase|nr:Gfo/Idh/MocA family oxidoreductase [Thermoguttaceae bacterium]